MSKSYNQLLLEINGRLKNSLSTQRYTHILGVIDTACDIGNQHLLDSKKLTIAALLHDIAKNYSLNQLLSFCKQQNIDFDLQESANHGLLHGKVAKVIAREDYEINDEDILNAIVNHTTGRINMSTLEEVIFVADYSEPNRKLANSKNIIELSFTNLKKAVFKVISEKVIHIIKKGGIIHPKSIEVYNAYQRFAL